jgi:hypothetical protein
VQSARRKAGKSIPKSRNSIDKQRTARENKAHISDRIELSINNVFRGRDYSIRYVR